MATGGAGLTQKEILEAQSGDTFDTNASTGLPPTVGGHGSVHRLPGSATSMDDADHSPLPTRRNRTFSASERAAASPTYHGKIKTFCREKGHGSVTPHSGGEDIFIHISDIDGDTVPKEGDEVIFKTVMMPPKMEKPQAVHVQIIAMKPGVKHDHWEDTSTAPSS